MLALVLVIGFLLLVGVLHWLTHEDAEKVLTAIMVDTKKAHRLLSAEPRKSANVQRAIALLDRWVS